MESVMFSLDSTQVTEQWFRITWLQNGNTCTIERPANEAASRIADFFADPTCTVTNVTTLDQ